MKLTHYRLTWENESGEQEADFWLPAGVDPHEHVSSLLNLVELDASEFLYAYKLEVE